MMSSKKKRKFTTVKEIFAAYIPDYKISEQGPETQDQIVKGDRLAANLIKQFRENLRKPRKDISD